MITKIADPTEIKKLTNIAIICNDFSEVTDVMQIMSPAVTKFADLKEITKITNIAICRIAFEEVF